MIKNALLVLAALASPVLAQPDERSAPERPGPEGPNIARQMRAAERGDQEILAPPPTYKANNVNVDEKLGARVPVDAMFRDHNGKLVRLGDVLDGELPTILTFNYADCPMLCSLQLNGLSSVMPQIADKHEGAMFRVGGQYKIVTITLEPNESIAKMARMRDRYIERLPQNQRELAEQGWTFLVAAAPGDGAAIRRVADSVGFAYTYIADRDEWAHPAALIFLSVKGTVTRYVYGIEFDPNVMRESLFKAGASEPASAIGFMNRCYHYNPDANNYSRAGVLALRVGAAGFVVLLLSGLGVMRVIRKSRPVSQKGNPA